MDASVIWVKSEVLFEGHLRLLTTPDCDMDCSTASGPRAIYEFEVRTRVPPTRGVFCTSFVFGASAIGGLRREYDSRKYRLAREGGISVDKGLKGD